MDIYMYYWLLNDSKNIETMMCLMMSFIQWNSHILVFGKII